MARLFRQTNTILFIDTLILLISILGVYRAVNKAGIPAEFIYNNDRVQFVSYKDTGIETALQSDDIFLSIDGLKISKIEDIEFICDAYNIGDEVSARILRNGQPVNISLRLQKFYTNSFVLIISILGGLFFILGVFVFLKLPRKDEAYVYNWLSMSIMLMVTVSWGRFSLMPFGMDHIMRIAFSAAYPFVPALFVHFSYVFPAKKPKLFNRFMPLLYAAAGAFALWQVFSFLMSLNYSLMDWFHHFRNAFNTSRWFFAACILFGIANFFHSYFNAQQEIDRRKLRWIILGLVVGPLVSILFWQIPQALFSKGLIPEEMVMIILAAAPVTFTIAILRYRLLDIDLIFRRSSVYFFALGGLIIIYAVIVGTAAAAAAWFSVFTLKTSLIASAIAAVVTAMLFEPVRKRVQFFVDKKFFRVRYDYRIAQNRFTNHINQSYNTNHIIEFTVQELEDLLHPRCIAFYLRAENGESWELAAERSWIYGKDDLIDYLSSNFLTSSEIISLHEHIEADIDFLQAEPDIFLENKIALAVSCREQNSESSGFLVLGRKKSTPVFGQEDIDLLRTIASHVGLAIEHIRLQQNLMLEQAEAQRLDELNRLKSFFVSSVSHELQTPLTSIKMFAELLKTKVNLSAEDKHEYLEIIEGESERLTRLINNVLDYSRIERGVKEYHFSSVDLKEVIENVMNSMKFQIKQHGFKTEVQLPASEIILTADRDAVQEALINLIANAVKYSKTEKEISVSAVLNSGRVSIAVADKGIGITEDDQEKIFNTFYRSAEKYIQASGGAGLGLAIVSHIVKAHRGTIDVNSRPGEGSVFTINLPLEDAL